MSTKIHAEIHNIDIAPHNKKNFGNSISDVTVGKVTREN